MLKRSAALCGALYILLKIVQKCSKVQEKQNQQVHTILELAYQAHRESGLNHSKVTSCFR